MAPLQEASSLPVTSGPVSSFPLSQDFKKQHSSFDDALSDDVNKSLFEEKSQTLTGNKKKRQRSSSSGGLPSKKKKTSSNSIQFDSDDEDSTRSMSKEEEEKLRLDILKLPGDKQDKIIDMIRNREPSVRDSDPDVMEYDLLTLKQSTIRELESYVASCSRPKKRKVYSVFNLSDSKSSSSSSSSSDSSDSEADSSSSDSDSSSSSSSSSDSSDSEAG